MRAVILSIGSELILGHLTDTNATFLAQELVGLGVELLQVVQIGDDRERIAQTIRRATAEADLTICTGGVGPTADDLTRESIADVVGETPVVDPVLLETVRGFFTARGATMPEPNAKQAWLIPSATILPNPVGTAPGWLVATGDRLIVAMPGVPREMVRMWRDEVVPRLAPRLPRRAIRSTTFKTVGIGESAAEQLLTDLVQRSNPVVATYAKDDGVHVRVTAFADAEREAERLRDEAGREVERRLRQYVYATDDTSLPRALARLAHRRSLTIGIVERGTGGRFASLLAADPDVGGVLVGALSLPGPSRLLPTPQASDLADDARERFGSSLAVGITLDVAPVGQELYAGMVTVALAGALQVVESVPTRARFEEVQRRAALTAADVLHRALTAAG